MQLDTAQAVHCPVLLSGMKPSSVHHEQVAGSVSQMEHPGILQGWQAPSTAPYWLLHVSQIVASAPQ